VKTSLAPGFHVAAGRPVDSGAYDQSTGQWSRLFVPSVLDTAGVDLGCRVLDMATGTGEAALAIAPVIGASGLLVGADIAPAMLESVRTRLHQAAFLPVAADGQALPFADGSFDAVICQLGLQFFPNPGLGLTEFRRVLRDGGRVAICVASTPDRIPLWGILAEVLGRLLPEQRHVVQLSFSLADKARLEQLFAASGFDGVRVERQQREGVLTSFDEYWKSLAAGQGSIAQVCLMLPETKRNEVREEVRARLAQLQSTGALCIRLEMLIASGRK
jgi:ubiquinone/menaquinone biosynthesis C-methylase UbiE